MERRSFVRSAFVASAGVDGGTERIRTPCAGTARGHDGEGDGPQGHSASATTDRASPAVPTASARSSSSSRRGKPASFPGVMTVISGASSLSQSLDRPSE